MFWGMIIFFFIGYILARDNVMSKVYTDMCGARKILKRVREYDGEISPLEALDELSDIVNKVYDDTGFGQTSPKH